MSTISECIQDGLDSNNSTENYTWIEIVDVSIDCYVDDLYNPNDLFLSFFIIYGFLGFLVHAYIIFAYNYKRDERLNSTQLLILGLSINDALCLAIQFFVYTFFASDPKADSYFVLPISELFIILNEGSVYAFICLLSFSRYCVLCAPSWLYREFFSTFRVKVLFGLIWGLFFVFITVQTVLYERLLTQDDENTIYTMDGDLPQFDLGTQGYFHEITIMFWIIQSTYTLFLALTILFYLLIGKSMLCGRLRMEREAILRANLDVSLDTQYTQSRSIVILALIAIPILTLHLICSTHLRSPDYCFFLNTTERQQFIYHLVYAIFSTIFILNPIVFYKLNTDFEIRFLKPLKDLKMYIRPGGEFVFHTSGQETSGAYSTNPSWSSTHDFRASTTQKEMV